MVMKYCTECGKKISSQADHCPNCGHPNRSLSKNLNGLYKGNKSMVVYLLLCWFFGVIGGHRYYSGKIGSAVVMTILTLTIFGMIITGIWAFVDLIVGFCNLNTPENIFEN